MLLLLVPYLTSPLNVSPSWPSSCFSSKCNSFLTLILPLFRLVFALPRWWRRKMWMKPWGWWRCPSNLSMRMRKEQGLGGGGGSLHYFILFVGLIQCSILNLGGGRAGQRVQMWLKVGTVNSYAKNDCVCIHYISSNRERSLNSNPPQIAVTQDIVNRSCPCFLSTSSKEWSSK